MKNDFYRAFEDRYRGSRELIKGRLLAYLPFIGHSHAFYPAPQAVDLGCGRGEWLELLGENGFDIQGVDIDEAMLQACRERGLNVKAGDALSFLRSLPDESQCVVSGFHIVEHLAFDDVRKINDEAMRVLKPGGLLILETPNPENLMVGCSWFYRDPTHIKPIPTELLAFVSEYAGFTRVKVVRLNESPALLGEEQPDLLAVLAGASPDYAVIAQKHGEPAIMEASAPAFDCEFGITFDKLATRFQKSWLDQLGQLEARVANALAHAAQAERLASRAEERAEQVGAVAFQAQEHAIQAESLAAASGARAEQAENLVRISEARAVQAEASAAQALARIVQAEASVSALLSSTSWRVTAPLRCLGNLLKRARAAVLQPQPRVLLRHCALYVARRPQLKRRLQVVLDRFPGLKARLLQSAALEAPAEFSSYSIRDMTPDAILSNAHAKRIHANLQSAIRRRQRDSH